MTAGICLGWGVRPGRKPHPAHPFPTSLLLLLWLKGQGLAGELEGSSTYPEQGCAFSADPCSV